MKAEKSSWFKRHKVLTVILVLVLIGIVSAAANGGSNVNNKASNSSSSTSSKTKAATAPTAHVGSMVAIGGSKGLAVTVQQVIDPASSGNSFATPDAGKRFVAIKLQIVNNGSASYTDDANINLTLIGSDNQSYTADFDSVSECTNFSSGEYTLTSGASATGCVVYEVPDAVTVAKLQFQSDHGFSESTGEWLVP